MQNGDEASPSIILGALFVKMLVILEPCGTFGSNCVYLYILSLAGLWYTKP